MLFGGRGERLRIWGLETSSNVEENAANAKTKEDTVKKLWLGVALVALGGLASTTFADVQNIRLSGDIRIRGYWLDNVSDVTSDNSDTDSFISQRTRVSVEADLEDHVLVVVTLKAEGLWGSHNDADDSSGAGTADASGNDAINRRWEVGVTEAYVQLNEVFYTPATLKLGRQYLHYGRGLIISSVEQEYNYDAARLVLDFYPLTVDVVYAKLVENTPFGQGTGARDTDLVFVNGRYEMADAIIKNIEGYFGYVVNNTAAGSSSRVPPSAYSSSPLLIGLRSDMELMEGLATWIEGAYQFGADGTADDESLSAWLLNAGGRYTLKDAQWSPAINANWTWASGDSTEGGHNEFRPWFDYVEGYNGYLLSPRLANIHIFNLGASVKPYENTTLSVQGYYYLRHKRGGPDVFGNMNLDNGGIPETSESSSREIGWEIDTIFGYDYSKDVRFQLVYAAFIPGNAYTNGPADGNDEHTVAHEARAEVNVRF